MPGMCHKGHLQEGVVPCHAPNTPHPPHTVSGPLEASLSSKVRIQGQPAAYVGSKGPTDCPDPHPPDGGGFEVTKGSEKVFIEGKPAVRLGDPTNIHDVGTGVMVQGSSKVMAE